MLSEDFPKRRANLKAANNLNPTRSEFLLGVVCVLLTIANLYLKFYDRTMIFMFNPCHAMTLSLIICCLTSHSRVGELAAIYSFTFAFGGWLGLLISEADEHAS